MSELARDILKLRNVKRNSFLDFQHLDWIILLSNQNEGIACNSHPRSMKTAGMNSFSSFYGPIWLGLGTEKGALGEKVKQKI